MAKNKSVVIDYTQGRIAPQLISFAIPFILANILQQLYNVVDSIVVGQVCGSAGLSAVSIGGQMVQLVTSVCMGFSNGGQVLVSQHVGAKDSEGVGKVVGTMFSFIAILALVLALVCIIFRRTFLGWMNTPPEAFDQAARYMLVCSFGYVFVSGYNSCCGLLRGVGDSKRPLIYIGVSSVINLILDLIFVGAFRMEAQGAAIATVIAQIIACFVAFRSVLGHRDEFGLGDVRAAFRMDRQMLRSFLKLGIPMAIQTCAIQLSQLFVNSFINSYGVAASAAMGVGRKLQQFCNIVSMGVRQAASSMIGQNFGAGKNERVSKIVHTAVLVSLCASAVFSSAALLFPRQIFAIFTTDAEVLSLAPTLMKILVLAFFASAFMSGYLALIQGIGFASLFMVIALLDGIVFRIGLSMLFGVWMDWGLNGLFLGNNLAIYATAIPAGIYFYMGTWKKRKALVRRRAPAPENTSGQDSGSSES